MSKCALAVTAVIAAVATSPAARSQTAPPAGDSGIQLKEVIVTATKRKENLQKVSASISVVSAAQLAESNITRTTDIVQLVPGVQVTSPNTGSDNFYSIRGVTQSDYSEHQESPVAVYSDGVYQSMPAGTSALLFDTQQVEVLRGPQGTLFGRNATGGVVQYLSTLPSADRDAYVDVTYGAYNQVKVEAASNATLADGLYARVAVAYNTADSYFHNILAPPNRQPFNQNDKAGRFELLYQPRDSDLSILWSVRDGGTHIRGGVYRELATYPNPNNNNLGTAVPPNVNIFGTCPGCDALGQKNNYGFYWAAAPFTDGHDYSWTQGSTLTVKDRFAGLDLTSISDYTGFWKDYDEDSDSTAPLVEQTYPTLVNVTQLSQELRLDNGTLAKYRWVAGLYYLNIDGHYYEGQSVGIDSPPDFYGETYQIQTYSAAGFYQAEYDFAPKWTLTLGGRETYDHKTDDFVSAHHTGLYGNSPVNYDYLVFNQSTYGDLALISKADWSGRAALNYQLTDNVMTYVSWNRGIKSGGWTQPVVPVGINPDTYKFGEERLYAYEAGEKSEWWDHRLRVNADVYYYQYLGYQAFNFYGQSQVDFNAPAKIKGSELEILAAPIQGLRIGIGTALTDATADKIPLPDGVLAVRTLGQAPHWSQTWQVSYRVESVTFEGDASYRSPIYYYISDAPSTYEGGVYLQNFHVDYVTPNPHLTLSAFVTNAFNKQYFVNILDESSIGFAQRVVGIPRWWGIKADYRFD